MKKLYTLLVTCLTLSCWLFVADAQTVRMPDANLAAVVRDALDLAPNATITKQAMQGLTRLDAPDSQISNLTGLEHATQLEFLELRRNQIRNILPLANLKNLKGLILEVNDVRDISPLANLTQLTLLYIAANPISDFTPLANLTELRALSLWDIRVSDLTLLADLTELTHLYLWNSNISDITPLANLTKLRVLHLKGNQIRNVGPLVNLTQLEELTLTGNPIQDMAPLRTLKDKNPELKLDIEISGTPVPGPSLNAAGPKIEGPWLWMIAPTGQEGGRVAAISGKDYLAAASGGTVTEQQIAENGVKAGALVGNRAWTPGKLAPTGGDNIGETVNAIGLGSGDIDNHVAYGSIALNAPHEQNTTMYVGSDDAVKVWLNGKLVHDNPVDRGADDYQDDFPATLKKGKNILLVAVYEAGYSWSGFFGFKNNAVYSILTTPVVQIGPAQHPPIYWIDKNSGTLYRLVDREVENFLPSVPNATSLAIDPTDNKIYWTRQTGPNTSAIQRAGLNDRNVQTLQTSLTLMNSIALNDTGTTFYWTDILGKIKSKPTQGSRVTLLRQNLSAPKGLVWANDYLYWGEATGQIRRMNLRNTSRQVETIATSAGEPISLAVHNDSVYWTEISGNASKLKRVNTDGTGLTELKTLTGTRRVWIAIDGADAKIYLTRLNKIERRNLSGQNTVEIVASIDSPGSLVLGGYLVRSIPVVSEPVQPTQPPNNTAISQYDVNQDGSVDNVDVSLVAVALFGGNPPATPGRLDVNGDGELTLEDLTAVSQNTDDSDDAGAPVLAMDLKGLVLDFDRVQEQIEMLLSSDDMSVATQRLLLYLQHLLASARPDETVLLANYPNPFNPETWIPYHLATSTDVKIRIYNAQGRLVREVTLGHQSAGYYTSRSRAAYWDGRNQLGEPVASGVYFYTLSAGEFTATRKMLIRK